MSTPEQERMAELEAEVEIVQRQAIEALQQAEARVEALEAKITQLQVEVEAVRSLAERNAASRN